MSRARKAAARSQRPSRGRAQRSGAGRGADPVQARLLAIIALVFAAGAIILPLPLGLAAILLAGWGLWRHGRTGLGALAFLAAAGLTAAGFAAGMAL